MGNLTLEKPKFEFNEKDHVYTLDGKRLYGTTNILSVIAKPVLIGWAANCVSDYIKENCLLWKHEDGKDYYLVTKYDLEIATKQHQLKKQKAGELGTSVHAQIEVIIKEAIDGGGYLKTLTSDNKQVQQFINWATDNKVQFLDSEKRLYSEEWWVAGTADFVCMKEGKLFIGDVKTSSNIYPEHFWQASAYAKMAEEMGEYMNFDGVIIVNIPKKGGLKVKENYDLQGNQRAFEACITIFKQLEAIK